MSVKICYNDGTMRDFCEEASIVEQLDNANHVHLLVEEDHGKSAQSFLQKLANISPFEIVPPFDVNVEHKNLLIGAKIAKEAKKLKKQIYLYWLAKEMATLQKKIDSELGDMVKDIKNREV